MKKQQGAVLVVALMMLVVLTLYGLSSSNNALLQVKMTAVNNDTELALRAAESAIQQAVLDIENLTEAPSEEATSSYQSRGGFHLYSDDAVDIFADTTWDESNFAIETVTSDVLSFTQQSARYFIVYLGVSDDEQAGGSDDAEWRSARSRQLKTSEKAAAASQGGVDQDETTYLFRIVAMGEGAAGSARRIVEAFYVRTFPPAENTQEGEA